MKLTTPDMDPAKIEVHDLRRDVEAWREEYPTLWERYTHDANAAHDRLLRTVLQATAAANPYAPALATLVLNLEAPREDEPA